MFISSGIAIDACHKAVCSLHLGSRHLGGNGVRRFHTPIGWQAKPKDWIEVGHYASGGVGRWQAVDDYVAPVGRNLGCLQVDG